MDGKKKKALLASLCSCFTLLIATVSFHVFAATEIGLFHDQGELYMSTIEPSENEPVQIKLRIPNTYAASNVTLQYSLESNESNWKEVVMQKGASDSTGYYTYWSGEIPGQSRAYYYQFKVVKSATLGISSETTYYTASGEAKEQWTYRKCFQVIPGFTTPDWAKGAYWYFINPDGFYNGNVHNDASDTDTQKGITWNTNTGSLMDRYGGDLEGITEKIDYLKTLGVEGVYLTPIWETRQNLGYAPLSYDKISPNLGNDEDLKKLINTLHSNENNMKIALDAVFTYTPRDGAWFDYYNEWPLDNSNYSDLFIKDTSSNAALGGYETIWGMNPRIDLSQQFAQNLFWKNEDSILKRYLSNDYGIDGWRFDAVASSFIKDDDNAYTQTRELAKDIRTEVKTVEVETGRNALLICEDSLYELLDGGFDTSYGTRGYFRRWFNGEDESGNVYTQENFADNLKDYLVRPRTTALCTLNLYDLHDESRITSNTTKDAAKLRALNIIQMTFLGSPCTYYGDEVGVENNEEDGFGAQKYNSFNWNEEEWDMSIYNLQCALGQLRKEYSALKTGVINYEVLSNDEKIMCFGRFDSQGTVLTITNQTDTTYKKTLDVSKYNVTNGATLTDYITGKQYVVNEGEITNVEILPGGNILVTGSKSSKYSTSDIYDINKYNTTKTYMLEFDKTVTGETQTLLSYVADTDYTIKVKLRNLTASNDGFAGVMVGEDTNNMVFAGKMMIENAEYLVLGERIDGAFNIHEKINNIDTEDVIVQLQKCGMEYSAVYSVDGGVTWLVIGDDIKCNYSVIKTGLYVGANTTVNVTYITYGDYIHDNNTINTPCYPDERDCSFIQNYKNISRKSVHIYPESVQSEFTYVNGGIQRTNGTGIAHLSIQNRTFDDFRIMATLVPDNNFSAGFTMLRSKADPTTHSDGYTLALGSGTLALYHKGILVASKTGISIPTDGIALIAEHIGERLYIYRDHHGTQELLFQVNNVTEESGYVSYYLNGNGKILNDSIHTLTQNWIDVLGNNSNAFVLSDGKLVVNANLASQTQYAHLSGNGYTDVLFSGKITLNQSDTNVSAYSAGLMIGAKERAVIEQSDGYVVALHEDGKVKLSRNGEVLATTTDTYEACVTLQVMQKDNQLSIYINDSYSDALSRKLTTFNGGTVGIVSVNTVTTFENLQVRDITNVEATPVVREGDTIYSNDLRFQNGTYDEKNNIFSTSNMSAYADFDTGLTEDDQTMFFHIRTDGAFFDVRYREGTDGVLALRITKSSVVAILNNTEISNKVLCNLDFTKEINVILRSTKDNVRLWLNGIEVAKLTYSNIQTSNYSKPYYGVFLPVTSGESATVRCMAVWKETSNRTGYPVINREDIIGKLTYKSTSIDATNITLNDTPQQLLFTTDLGTKDYYMSFEVSNNGATVFDILCRGNEQGYVALRLTDGMVQAVENGAVTKSQEIIGMSLAKIKKVALKATATGIILWIDEVPIALSTDFFNTTMLSNSKIGLDVKLSTGKSVTITNLIIWTADTK